jgi:hypothetical protein
MKPLIDNSGNKILIINNDKIISKDLETLKRVCFILGEPINMIKTNYVLSKTYYIKKLNSNPFI